MKTKTFTHEGTNYSVTTNTRRYGNTFYTWLNSITNDTTGEKFSETLDPWNSNRIPKADLVQLLP